jgi:hypothetical protein
MARPGTRTGRFYANIEVVRPTELKDTFARLAHRFANAAGGSSTLNAALTPMSD